MAGNEPTRMVSLGLIVATPFCAAAAGSYSDAKEFLYAAIAPARRLGQAATEERLSQRLTEIKAVYRSQFIN